ncbi:MAG: isoleucine--tRNA ligase [Candidatus Terraquivivens tikiterensis]|uniref:Isoleucine--tRNA ligase n=1 Tax=Candidatus Terraquivivens tikiterensis TaxID=1980982 RepID=A0A2R7Y368_9ARCH|nr:MAG: isoleucine--tRNA ligase [Candidatus Terraquivivens tikiterensis]
MATTGRSVVYLSLFRGRYDPKKVEEIVASWWRERDIQKKVLEANKNAPIFSFLEGPPTANGFMHVGHARGRIYKDIVLRYQTMKGLNVWRRAGWDCLGLPTELEVEKRLGFTSKKDIEAFGLERFVEEANKLVDYYIDHWRRASERLGLWLDYENAYETRKENYMEHVWALLKKAYEDGNLVESFKVVHYCPSCETPLSSHEVSQGYEEVEDPSVYVKFPLKRGKGEYVVIWTTTPWTLPGNEAVAVNPDAWYVKCRVGNEIWIVGEEALERAMGEMGVDGYRVVQRIKGSELVGEAYRHPLDEEVPSHKEHKSPAHTIVAAPFVKMTEGTGCVHIAPAHGPEDFELGRSLGIPIFCPIRPNGTFAEEGGVYANMYFKQAGERVLQDLRSKGLLVKEGKVVHAYPFCWRCGTPLIYLASRQWFLRIDRIKKKMLEENSKVRWQPQWAGMGRFGDWIASAEDWCISRTKVWGTPLPVWICTNCGAKKVIGSRAELEGAIKKPEKVRLLRPWIDEFVFRCEKCGGEMRRDQFVLDTWLDSGVAHFASVDYLRDKSLFTKLFPYDFITEAIDQTRGWFYTLLFTSVLYFGKAPFTSVLNQGHVLDSEGKKMSKSKGNVVWAMDAFDRFGVDPLRLYLASKAKPWDTINFVPTEVDRVAEDLNILWNVFAFAKTYFDLDRFDPERYQIRAMIRYADPVDRWLLSRINSLVKVVTSSLEDLEICTAAKALRSFVVEDLSRVYIRSIRRRIWVEKATVEKLTAYSVLFYVMRRLVALLAPFVPYLAEYLFSVVKQKEDPESVHLLRWPKADEEFIDQELEDSMDIVQSVLSSILAARQKAGRKLRWPVKSVTLVPKSLRAKQALSLFKDYLRSQANAEDVLITEVGERPSWLRRKAKPVLSSLGPKFGPRLGSVLRAIHSIPAEKLEDDILDDGVASITLQDGTRVELTSSDVSFSDDVPEHISHDEGRFADAYVDLTETESIKLMSLANELIRRIQVMRREIDLDVEDVVECVLASDSKELAEVVGRMGDYIEEETRTRLKIHDPSFKPGEQFYRKDWSIGQIQVSIALSKERKEKS